MKKHSSYDIPPNKPFWKKSQKSSCSSERNSHDDCDVSPSKHVNLRGQCDTTFAAALVDGEGRDY